jgi:cytochrome c oxidase assembly factor CtaG
MLASVWPPLFLLAIPAWLARRALRLPVLGGFATFAAIPAVAILLFNGDIYFWHVPYFYDFALHHEAAHILEHLTFMFFGVVNWWPVLAPVPEARLSYPAQMLYLFADGMFMMVLGILFTFSPVVFYTAYTSAPRLWDMSLDTDQQIGGLIMWYPGNIPYGVLLVAAFYRWFESGQPGPPEEGEEPMAITYNENARTTIP